MELLKYTPNDSFGYKHAIQIAAGILAAIVIAGVAAFTLTALGIIINELWHR